MRKSSKNFNIFSEYTQMCSHFFSHISPSIYFFSLNSNRRPECHSLFLSLSLAHSRLIFLLFFYFRIEKKNPPCLWWSPPFHKHFNHPHLTSIPFFWIFFILCFKWNEWYNTCTYIHSMVVRFYIIYALLMLHRKIKTLFFASLCAIMLLFQLSCCT